MNKVIQLTQNGGPEVMHLINAAIDTPGNDEVCVQQKACGLNFIDVYFRTGLYKHNLPGGLGMEGARIVEAVGSHVTHLKVGDRVAYAGGQPGAYAQYRTLPASLLVKLPDSI